MKLLDFIESLYEKSKDDPDFTEFLRKSGISYGILNLIKQSKLKSLQNDYEEQSNPEINSNLRISSNEKLIPDISNSDGFSKIIFEDLKKKCVLSQDKIAQEYLLNRKDIRECFKYISENFNNVQLHQGKIWVIEYIGGL